MRHEYKMINCKFKHVAVDAEEKVATNFCDSNPVDDSDAIKRHSLIFLICFVTEI